MLRQWIVVLGIALCVTLGQPANASQEAGESTVGIAAQTPEQATDASAPDVSRTADLTDASKSMAGRSQEAELSDSENPSKLSRTTVLIGSLTVFMLAVFVGFEVITKVPPTLHTPLMSGSNAISGITIVGALLTAGHAAGGFGSILGFLAVILAMINVVGGFLVTHRMLMMFKKR